MPDETLGHILQAYYGGSGLNMKFVEMAIVQFNRHALCVATPTFYMQTNIAFTISESIQGLHWVKKFQQDESYGERQNEIFFFGG